jgi:hypothetical protein
MIVNAKDAIAGFRDWKVAGTRPGRAGESLRYE